MKTISVLLLLFFLPACAFYPTSVSNQDRSDCDLYLKKLTLDITDSQIQCHGSSKSAAACIVLAGVVAGGTAVVSGSIVLIGNTLHWLEKQGKCEDGFLSDKVLDHKKPLLDEDGVLLNHEPET
jgi:hypothetical protein